MAMTETRLTPARRAELARLCVTSRDGIAMMFGDSHYDRQTWGAIKPHLDFVTDTIVPEALAEVDRLTAQRDEWRAESMAMAAGVGHLQLSVAAKEQEAARLTARWEALKAWARDCDLSVDVDDMTIEMTRLECEQ